MWCHNRKKPPNFNIPPSPFFVPFRGEGEEKGGKGRQGEI